jgi:hypothetical protein
MRDKIPIKEIIIIGNLSASGVIHLNKVIKTKQIPEIPRYSLFILISSQKLEGPEGFMPFGSLLKGGL